MSFEQWTNNNEPEEIEVRSWIDKKKSLGKFFNRDGSPKTDRNADGSFSVGLSRFHKPDTVEEADGFRVEYRYLPKEAKNAIKEWRKREVDPFLKSKTGRPAGSGTYQNEEDFILTVREIILQLSESGERLTRKNVAEKINVDERTLSRWVNNFTGKHWKEFIEDILTR